MPDRTVMMDPFWAIIAAGYDRLMLRTVSAIADAVVAAQTSDAASRLSASAADAAANHQLEVYRQRMGP